MHIQLHHIIDKIKHLNCLDLHHSNQDHILPIDVVQVGHRYLKWQSPDARQLSVIVPVKFLDITPESWWHSHWVYTQSSKIDSLLVQAERNKTEVKVNIIIKKYFIYK